MLYVENKAQHCRLGLFQDSYFAGDLEDSKSTSGEFYAPSEAEHFVLISWMCKKQTSVSHSCTESEIISLDAGLRMDGVMEVLCSRNSTNTPTIPESGNRCGAGNYPQNTSKLNQKKNRDVEQLSNVDHVPTNAHPSQGKSQLHIFEDAEAVIKMVIKGRSPTMRHVSRTQRVAIDWLFDRINLDSKGFKSNALVPRTNLQTF